MRTKNTLLILLITLFCTSNANARETFASCGGSNGYTYYVLGGFVSESAAGYTKDAIQDGTIQFTHADYKDWDVVQIDGFKKPYSAKGNGGSVTFVGGTENGFNIMVFYPTDTIEVYTLRPLTNEVTWVQSKSNSQMSKATVMKANCLFQ
jgi:hypothetical protein|tara:strand:- start:172 stop:621 length:450 start_codon:yes stop_codon:yes gene_type:complete